MSGCSCRLRPWCHVIAALAASCAQGAEVVWTGGGGDLLWGNRLNWAGGRVPGIADDVVVPELPGEVMIEVTSSVHVRSIVCEEGISFRSQPIVVDAMSRIAVLGDGYSLSIGEAGLTLTEGGVLPQIIHNATPGRSGGVFVIAAGADAEMRWTRGIYTGLRNEGVLRWTGTTVMDSSTVVFDNFGDWELTGGGFDWVGTGRIRNYGTIRHSGDGVARIYNRGIAFELESSGHIEVESGTLALDTVGALSGTCDIAAGATLRAVPFFSGSGGQIRFVGDRTISGGGRLEAGWASFDGGLALEGNLRAVGPVTIMGPAIVNSIDNVSSRELAFLSSLWCGQLVCDGGSVRFEGETSIGRAALGRCMVYGAGDVTIREDLSRFGQPFIGFAWTGDVTFAEGSRGVVNYNIGNYDLAVAGDLSLSSGWLRLRELAVAPSGVLRMALGSSGGASAQAAVLDGRCEIGLSPGFDPLFYRLFSLTILSAPQITGDFATMVLPPAPPVGAYELKRTASTISVVHDVFDYNGDGSVDANDLVDFFGRWDAGDRYGDVNADGHVDSDDVTFFITGWEAGGR